MKVNISEPVGCEKICIHPNKRVSFEFVGKNKNFTEAQSYCEDLNGTLAEDLNRNAYLTIQSCCKSIYDFRIGLIQDEACASNSTHPFRRVSEINKCRKVKHLNITNNSSLGNPSCKTVSIATSLSSTEIPQATLYDCKKKQYFICRKNLSTSNPEVSTTTTITATSTQASMTKQSTTNRTISTVAASDRRQTIEYTRFTGQSLLTSATAHTDHNTTEGTISYPALIAGVTLGFILLVGLLSFFVYRRCKKSDFQKIPSKISSNEKSFKQDHFKNSQNIRMGLNSNLQPANAANIDNCAYDTVIPCNEREVLQQFQINENLSNFNKNVIAAAQPQQAENKNEKKSERDTETAQPQQDESDHRCNINQQDNTAVQPPNDENQYSAVNIWQQQNEKEIDNEYDTVAEQLQQDENEHEYDTVAEQLQQDENEHEYDTVAEQLDQDENKHEYDTVAKHLQQEENENKYATVAVQVENENVNENGTVAPEPNQDESKKVNVEDCYSKLNFQSENRKSEKRNNYQSLR